MAGLKTRHRAWAPLVEPTYMIPLVEVVKTEWTDPDIAHSMYDLLLEAKKTPVMVEKDVPGFIGNRFNMLCGAKLYRWLRMVCMRSRR